MGVICKDIRIDEIGPSITLLGSDKHVRDVFVLTEKWDVEEDLQGLGISGEDDELGLTSVEGLGGLIGALSHLK